MSDPIGMHIFTTGLLVCIITLSACRYGEDDRLANFLFWCGALAMPVGMLMWIWGV